MIINNFTVGFLQEQSKGIYQCQPVNVEGLGGQVVHDIDVICKLSSNKYILF